MAHEIGDAMLKLGDRVRITDCPNTAYHGIVATITGVRVGVVNFPYKLHIEGAHDAWFGADEVELVA